MIGPGQIFSTVWGACLCVFNFFLSRKKIVLLLLKASEISFLYLGIDS